MNAEPTSVSVFSQTLLFVIGGTLFVVSALLVSRLIRPNRPNAQKLTSYESGETPQGPAWIQFNLRFYVLALIFILFEVEIVFLFPWSVVFANKELNAQTDGAWGWYAFVEMLIFILVLAIGLAYAWKMGHLDWVKSAPNTTDVKSPVPAKLYDELNTKYAEHKAPKENV
jgi:NADH-quinone oxidoreductase subunit A